MAVMVTTCTYKIWHHWGLGWGDGVPSVHWFNLTFPLPIFTAIKGWGFGKQPSDGWVFGKQPSDGWDFGKQHSDVLTVCWVELK